MNNTIPYFSDFLPYGWQRSALSTLYNHDYSLYTPELLFSGSVGSAKSILCAHWIISHCLRNKGACVAISRQGLPDLKKTLFLEIVEHLEEDPNLIYGKHYTYRTNTAEVLFPNGSRIIAVTFGDKRWGKVRSLKLSGIVIEEATEFDSEFYDEGGGFMQFKARLRRIPHIKENFLICATNPDEPTHFLYNYFIEGSKQFDSRKVFYSQTDQNIHLDPLYIKQLRQDYSPLEAKRFLQGLWISLIGKGVYAAYDPANNKSDKDYKINPRYPVRISFDFNIAEGKPMSAVAFQFLDDHMHIFDESVIHGSYTEDILEDMWDRGLLDQRKIIIHGDATGRSKTPASKLANYDVIRQYLDNKKINYEIIVPKANPPIRKRHRIVNAYCKNDLGQHRLTIYKNAKTAAMGMLTTKLKKGASYIEDDTKAEQHITTAIGYGLCSAKDYDTRRSSVRKLS